MYIRLVVLLPATGNGGQIRSMLEETVKSNPLGLTGALSESLFGELPEFTLSSLHENMEAMEKDRASAAANSDIMSVRPRIDGLVRQPIEVSLNELLVRGTAGSVGPYLHHTRFYPKVGKPGLPRTLLEDYTKQRQEAGRPGTGLTRQLFDESGPTFTLRDTFETLAEYENVTMQTQEKLVAFLGLAADFTRSPVSMTLRQIITHYGG